MSKAAANVSIDEVKEYWNTYPADFETEEEPGSKGFFEELRRARYEIHEPFLKDYVQFERYKGKKVLEIGCGMGSDAHSFASAGAEYTGVDLGDFNVRMTKKHLEHFGLKGEVLEMNAENLEFEDERFDLVYSHGVIHHSPKIEQIVENIHRVLKPGGEVHVMVYHKNSFRYYIEIMLLRRIGILLTLLPGGLTFVKWFTKGRGEMIEEYREMFQKEGWSMLGAERFMIINTDLVKNPLSRVFTKSSAMDLFHRFEDFRFKMAYMDWRRLPILRSLRTLDLLLGRSWGWFLFVRARKK